MAKPATIHWIAAALADRSRWVDGIATLTMKKSRVLMKTPVRTTSRVPRPGTTGAGSLADAVAAGAFVLVVVIVRAPGRFKGFRLSRSRRGCCAGGGAGWCGVVRAVRRASRSQ